MNSKSLSLAVIVAAVLAMSFVRLQVGPAGRTGAALPLSESAVSRDAQSGGAQSSMQVDPGSGPVAELEPSRPRWSPDDLPDTEAYRHPPTAEEVAARAADLDARSFAEVEGMMRFLPRERVDAVLRAVVDIDARLRDIELAHADDRALESEVSDERLELLRQRESAILNELSSSERGEWIGRMSEEAETVGGVLPHVDPERRAEVARIEWEFNRDILSDDADVGALRAVRDSKLVGVLENDGFEDYRRRSDTTFAGEQVFGEEQGLDAEAVARLYDWRADLDNEERRLVAGEVPDDERVAYLREEARKAREALREAMGPDQFAAYLESSAGLWLSRFEPEE